MNLGKVTVLSKAAAALLIVSLLQWPAPVEPAPVTTEKAACDVTKASIAARGHFPVSAIAFCDMVAADSSPRDYYILALHSTRKCEGICSTNMGWFAVEKGTGGVFEWDMAEEKLGAPVKVRP